MYLRKFAIKNIRSISEMEMTFDEGREAGWHVILGANGSGKSSVVKAFALLMMGERAAKAAGCSLDNHLIMLNKEESVISGDVWRDRDYDRCIGSLVPPDNPLSVRAYIKKSEHRGQNLGGIDLIYDGMDSNRTIWGESGWFSASFGAVRRFTDDGGVYARLPGDIKVRNHATVLSPNASLAPADSLLRYLRVEKLESEDRSEKDENSSLLDEIVKIINNGNIIPGNMKISDVHGQYGVIVKDGNGFEVPLKELSDGCQSIYSLTLEIISRMAATYSSGVLSKAIDPVHGTVQAPGVVMIDEVDAHLHPSWQRTIGRSLMRVFPQVQFIVTTHSPIVCRAVANEDGDIRSSIWRLPAPGADEKFRRLEGDELNALVYGNVVDAFDTELFGKGMTRSAAGREKIERLAFLNRKELDAGLTPAEEVEQQTLWRLLPSAAGALPKE